MTPVVDVASGRADDCPELAAKVAGVYLAVDRLSVTKRRRGRRPRGSEGAAKPMRHHSQIWLPILLICFAVATAGAQSFRVQCPTSTKTHPDPSVNNAEP